MMTRPLAVRFAALRALGLGAALLAAAPASAAILPFVSSASYSAGSFDNIVAMVRAPGSLYAVGTSSHGASGGDIYVSRWSDQSMTLLSSMTFNGSGNGEDGAQGVALDPSGNVYVLGYSSITTGTGPSVWLGKFTPALTFISSSTYPLPICAYQLGNANCPTDNSQQGGIVVDSATITIAVEMPVGSATAYMLFARFDTSLNFLSSTTYFNGFNSNQPLGMARDAAGNLYIVGGVAPATLTSDDIWVGKFNPNMVFLGSATVAGAGGNSDDAAAVAVDPTNNYIFVSGGINNTGTWDDLWMGKFSLNLNLLQTASIHSTSAWSDYNGIAVTGNRVYGAGFIAVAGQGRNAFLTEYDYNLNLLSSATFDSGSAGFDTANSVAIDTQSGAAWLAGYATPGAVSTSWLGKFALDSVPSAAVTSPPNGSFVNTLSSVAGTASELPFSGSASISTVGVSVQRLATGLYWDGANFASAPQVFSTASFSGASSGTWSLASGPLSASLISGASYQIQVQAADTLSQTFVSTTGPLFIFDTTLPALAITAPTAGSSLTSFPTVSGTAADPISGINLVQVSISSAPGFSTCWNGGSWAGCPSAQNAAGTGAWSYTPVPSGAALASGTTYQIQAEAFDVAGNVQIAVSSFVYTAATTTTLTGIGSIIDMTLGGGSLYAVGYTSNGASGDDILISRWNPASMTLISSVTFNGSANGNDIATGVTRDPATGNLYVVGSSSQAGQGGVLWLGNFDSALNMIATATLNIPINPNVFGNASGIVLAPNGNLYLSNSVMIGGLSKMSFEELNTSLTFIASTTYFNGFDQDYAYRLTADNASNIYIAGGVAPAALTSNDIWIGKFSSSLVQLATGTVAGPAGNSDQALDIKVDPSNSFLFVTGYINNSGIINDLWVAKYNLNLASLQTPTSVRGVGGSSAGAGLAVTGNRVYVTGEIATSSSYNAIYFAELDYSLNILSSSTYQSSGIAADQGFALAVDTANAMLLLGGEVNPAGTRSPWLGKYGLPLGGTPPVSAITSPAGFVNSVAVISGTEQAYSGTYVSSVAVSVQNLGTGQYWNGVSSFASASPVFSYASVSTGPAVWSYVNGALAGALSSGTSYQIESQATDSAGRAQGSAAAVNFTYDTTAPTAYIAAPANGSTLTSLAAVSGTAADAISGINVMSVQISSGPSYSTCWSGSIWTGCPLYQATTGTSTWSYSALPSLLAGTTYQIQARAVDFAANVSSVVLSSFVYANAVSTGSGAGTIYDMTSGGGSLYSVGVASMGANGDDIWISRWNPATLALISSATFNGSANGDDEATAITRDPATGNIYAVGFTSVTGFGDVAWVGKFDAALNMISTAAITTTPVDGSYAVASSLPLTGAVVAPNGNLYVVNTLVISGSATDIGITEFDSSLDFIASTTYNHGYSGDGVFRVVADTASNLYLAGIVAPAPATSGDLWIGKFTPNLAFVNAVTVAGPGGGTDDAFSLKLDPTNSVLFVTGSLYMGGGDYNLWVGKYDLNLNSLHAPASLSGVGSGSSRGFSLVVTSTRVYVSGNLSTSPSAYEVYFGELDYNLTVLSSSTYQSSGSGLDVGYAVVLDTPSASFIVGGEANPAGTQIPSLWRFGIPGTPPTSAITSPAAGFANSLPSIGGTAQAFNGATVSSVTVSIQNLSNGNYWNGSSFTASSATFAYAIVSTGTAAWTYAPVISTSLTNGTSYQIQSQAADSFLRTQVAVSTIVFTYDSAPPTYAVTTPANGAFLSSFPTIVGTAADPISGVSVVQVSISSSPGYNTCWNGSTWGGCPTYLSATGTSAWSLSTVPSGGALVAGTSYQLQVQAIDAAGNAASGSTTFSYSNAISTAGYVLGMADGGGSLYAVGFTSNGALGNNIWVSRWDPATLTLISSANFSGTGQSGSASSIVRDPASGNLYVVGSASMTGAGSVAWIGKFDSALNVIATATYNSIPISPVYLFTGPSNGAALAPNGNLYLANSVTSGANWIIGVQEFDSSLNFLSSTTYFNGFNPDLSFHVVADTASNLYVAGSVSPSPGANGEIWLGKFTPNLGYVNSVVVAPPVANPDDAWDLRLDPTNSILFVAGAFYNIAGARDAWVGKYDLNLNSLHAPASLRGAGPGPSDGFSLLVTSTRVYVTGGLSTSVSAEAILFEELDYNLNILSTQTFHSSPSALDMGYAVVYDTPSASVIVGGRVVPAGTAYQWLGRFTPSAASSYPGCAVTENVGSTQAYTTIQAAVNALPSTLTGPSCVVIRDGATYSEQVTVQNFTMNGSTIAIFADPASGLTPVVNPPVGNAAFVIANASVSVKGINIVPTHGINYGVLISSAHVSIANMNVQDAGGAITTAGIAASSWTTISFTTVSAGGSNATALLVTGSNTSISFSSAGASSPTGYALRLNGASANTVVNSFMTNVMGYAAYLTNANGNSISLSNVTSSDLTSTYAALYLTNSSSNTFSQNYFADYSADVISLQSGSNYNTIAQSTAVQTTAGGQDVIDMVGASFNKVTNSNLSSIFGGVAVNLDLSNYNTISQTSMTVNSMGRQALLINVGSSNTITQCYMFNQADTAVSLWNGSNFNTISQSGIVGSASSNLNAAGIYLANSSLNSFSQDSISNPGGFGMYYGNAATFNTVAQSTVASAAAGYSGLMFDSGSATNTVTNSIVRGSTAAYFANSSGDSINTSVLTATGTAGNAVWMTAGSANLSLLSNTIYGDAQGAGVFLDVNNAGNIVLGTNAIKTARYGLLISTQAAGASLAINTLNFSGLAAGATAVNFTGGTFVSTFTAVSFDSSVAVNVNAVAMSTGSSITMSAPSGARTGAAFSSDPSHYVHWPSTVAPTSAVTAPIAGFVNSLPSISGTAQAYNGATVSSVAVTVQNLASGLYWNGASSFSSAVPLFNSAALSTTTAVWTYANGALTTALINGTSYQIQSQATDSAALVQSGGVPVNFTYDAASPTVSISTPANGSFLTALAAVSGTAADAISGVGAVSIQISSGPSFGACWTGAAWAGCPSFQTAIGTTAWSYSSLPPLQAGTSYQIQAKAVDLAANVSAAATSSFVFLSSGVPPVSAITQPSGAYAASLAPLAGTAQAFGGANIASVSVSIFGAAAGKYWNGAAFVSASPIYSTASFVGASTVAWTYTNGLLASAVLSGSSYTIQSLATDSIAGAQTVPASFTVVVDSIPPFAFVQFPVSGATYATLPTVSGVSSDNIAVATVTLSVQQIGGNCYNPTAAAFTAACPAAFPAKGTNSAWNYPGIAWVNGQQYGLVATAADLAGNVAVSSTVFTVYQSTGLGNGTPGDGQGSVTILPASTAGCQLITATATYTAGPAGIAAGGAIALHVPNGWTQPQGANPGPGYVSILSTSGFTSQFNPAQFGNVTLGANWIVYVATSVVTPGQNVQFDYSGYPAQGSSAQGPQFFSFESQGAGNGKLVGLSSSPAVNVTPGAPALLSFSPSSPLTLGQFQNSPPMQLQLWDTCGVPTVQTGSPLPVALQATAGGATDANAVFYSTAGGAVTSVSVPVGGGLSPAFFYNTSTGGVTLENLVASAALASGNVTVSRPVNLLVSSASINLVAVDNGTPGTALTTTINENGAAGAAAFINFTLSNPSLNWEVIVSSNPSTFSPKLADYSGTGNPGRTLTWSGLNNQAAPPQFLPAGTYYVEIIAGGGSAINTSLTIAIAPSPSIYGQVTNGPGAKVIAVGPNSLSGNYAVAGSTGFFQIYGLQSGTAYLVQASSSVAISSSVLNVTASVGGVVATLAGTNAGSLTFQLPSLLEVSAVLPFPAPADITGTVSVHDSSFTHTGSGTLHFFAGGTSSDNGAQAFGANASTWTAIALAPGTYELDIAVPALGISTAVTGVVLNNGVPTFVPVALQKLVNVYGYAILPAVASANTWVSVSAQSMAGVSVYGGVNVPIAASSAIYSLFGLAPGSWTVTASAPGDLPAASTVAISGTADVGTASAGGLDLRLKAAGVLSGTLTVVGDTSRVNMSATCPNGAALCVPVTGYSAANFFNGAVTVVLATSTTQTSASFTFAGVPDGSYSVAATLNGFSGQGQNVSVLSGAGSSNLTLTANGSKVFVTVSLPAGVHPISDFKAVSLGWAGNLGTSTGFADMTAGTTIQYFASSATVQLSGLNADIYQFQAFNSATGMYRSLSAPVASNANASVLLDLSGPTYAVGGSFSLGNNITLPNSAGLSVSVSSVPGLLANTGNLSYCLLGYSVPPTISAAHLELLPAGASGAFASGPLQTAGAGCSSNLISPAGASGPTLPNPYLAYVAAIGANGSFSFSGVPPGVYLLRNNSQLDAAGDQMPQFSQTVVVTGTVAGLVFQAGSGNTLSGSVLAQSGVVLSRSMNVNLMNSAGQLTASAPVVFNNSNSASFSFPQLVDGSYTLLLQDSSYPKAYAAAPLQVRMAGQNLSGQNLSVLPTGTIKTKVVIQVIQPNGNLQSRLINPATVGLLPSTFKISAIADPWFSGGLGSAGGPNGGTTPVLDNGNEFVVDGLLPGTYDVKFTAPGVGAGGVNLVDTVVPGVVVTAGNVSDLGIVNLGGGTQLTGVVTDAASHAPLANIHVHAVPSQRGSGVDSTPIDATTDGSGAYVLAGLDPTVRFYDVDAAYRGVEVQGESLLPYQLTISPSVDLNAVTALNFALAPAAYSVTGRISVPAGGSALGIPGSSGQTAQGALIYFQKTGVIPVSNPIADIQFQTDYNGNFTIPSLSTGTYLMIATSLGYASLNQTVTITTASVNVGTLTMTQGATLTGSLTNPDGSNPSLGQVAQILAVTSDLSNILAGSLTTNPNMQTATAYTIAGFKPGLSYRVILLDSQNGMIAPPEAAGVVFPSTGTATINIVYRPVAPLVIAVAERQGSGFQLEFDMSQPLRAQTSNDSNLPAILTPVTAAGTLSSLALSQDREHLTAYYQPGVKESSFTFHLKGYSTLVNPASADPVNPQFLSESTVTFFTGIDGLGQTNVANLQGGDVLVHGDSGRVTLPPGSFNVAASSSVLITLQVAGEPLNGGLTTSGLGAGAAARLQSLRYGPQAYPTEILAAAAAVPPTVNPLSSFYNIFLPLGVSTALSKPAQLTVAYSTASDPTTLNLYWYNPAANAYVLTQDVTGAPPVIDRANHTITLNVRHFSTYVLFNSAQAVITGGVGAGALQAGNFPNPFDLGPKLVTPLHSGAVTINGTMLSISVPPNLSGEAVVNIFNVAGTRVRTVNFGSVQGGTFYYQNWDGTNDSGSAVASGVYIGELKIGSQTVFFKMAIIKGSGR